MPTPNMHPLVELRLICRGSVNLARRARNFIEQLGWESAEEVVESAVQHERGIAASAHKAETYSREAVKLMDEAQAPDSDGGEMITPREAKAIRAFTTGAAETAHNACDAATV